MAPAVRLATIGEVDVQIILVDPRLKKARTITLTGRTYMLAVGGLAMAVVLAVIGLFAVTLRISTEFHVPLLQDLVRVVMRDEVARKDQVMRDNVAAMARKLGEMQAQLMRLDALGERVSKMSGIRPEEFNFKELPGRGGADPGNGRAMTLSELQGEMERIEKGVGARADFMDVIESELVAAQVRRALLPQNTPVSEGFVGSSYGMRTDPFTGQLAMHAGVDFAAPAGTPIYAAAGGVVVSAEKHPVYGNTVVLDHGNDLATLYAHGSRLLVKAGDLVKKGQKIAEVGSTGRSTGPHLHFEVHVKGQPQNPSRFLAQQRDGLPFGGFEAKAPARQPAKAAKVDVAGLAQAAAARGPAASAGEPVRAVALGADAGRAAAPKPDDAATAASRVEAAPPAAVHPAAPPPAAVAADTAPSL
jgi:murein DD-endopeptidase MepM/ murein hydrolase activator NlpD